MNFCRYRSDVLCIGDNIMQRFLMVTAHANIGDLGSPTSTVISEATIATITRQIASIEGLGDVLVMCGTNDLLQSRSSNQMIEDMSDLLKHICERAANVLVLTVPPIPKVWNGEQRRKLNDFNKWLKTMASEKVGIIESDRLFHKRRNRLRYDRYERWYSKDRPDNVHWNAHGIIAVKELVDSHLDKRGLNC